MLILVHKAHKTLQKWVHNPNIGRLVSPREYARLAEANYPWAADNDAYAAWDEPRFLRMLQTIKHTQPPTPIFVAAPDVVGDWQATRRRFDTFKPAIGHLPAAYVLQDGQPSNHVPWDDITAVFIGGTTQYKLSPQAADTATEAKQRGKWVHMGRVNTRRRIRYAKAIGCDSIDGTQASMFTDTHLPWMLEHVAAPQQGMLS